ncbi:hypothetical protein LCGC14_0809890 [marine sediment metagenome]|uniref:DUF3800 domain-containing protein n=1 Tax=marine sediment metagenome TaxID=412755 RepID=A0A0F9Q778_9ZZZZ
MLLERIQMFTEDLSGHHAILFMDHENTEWNEKKIGILKGAIFFPENHPSYIKIDRIIPTIYFQDSTISMGIQIADALCYCIRRWLRYTIYNKKGEIDKINIKSFELIKEKFHKYPDCIQKGLKIFPSKCLDKIRKSLR